jgi:hypothetical protein
MLPSPRYCQLGLRAFDLSRPPLVRLRYGLVTRRHPYDGVVGRLQNPGFPTATLLPQLRGSDFYLGGTVSHGTRQPSLVAQYLDRMFFWNAGDLARKLEAFRDYYNGQRVHRALAGSTPARHAGAPCPAPAALAQYGWQEHCRGLFQIPIAA